MGRPGRPPELTNPRHIAAVIEEKEYELLKKIAELRGTSVSKIIREAILNYLEIVTKNIPETSVNLSELRAMREEVLMLQLRNTVLTISAQARALERRPHDDEVLEKILKNIEKATYILQRIRNPPPEILSQLKSVLEKINEYGRFTT